MAPGGARTFRSVRRPPRPLGAESVVTGEGGLGYFEAGALVRCSRRLSSLSSPVGRRRRSEGGGKKRSESECRRRRRSAGERRRSGFGGRRKSGGGWRRSGCGWNSRSEPPVPAVCSLCLWVPVTLSCFPACASASPSLGVRASARRPESERPRDTGPGQRIRAVRPVAGAVLSTGFGTRNRFLFGAVSAAVSQGTDYCRGSSGYRQEELNTADVGEGLQRT